MTGKVANMSNYPQGFSGGLLLDGLSTHKTHTGKVFYVAGGSDATLGTQPAYTNRKSASNANKGTFLEPFKTLAYAVEQCVDARGDVIVCLPGLVEDAEAVIDIEAGNVTIIGLGTGNDRPQITPDIADALDVEGDNVTIQNMYFNEATAERTAGAGAIDVVGANFRLLGCHADLGAHDDQFVTVTATGETPVFKDNKFVVTANGTVAVIDVEGVIDNPVIHDNLAITSVANFDTGFVTFGAIAVTNAWLKGNLQIGGGTMLNATAAVGTINEDSGAGPELLSYTASELDSETAQAVASVEAGSVALWGVLGRTDASNGATTKYGLSTEATGPQGVVTVGVAADEDLSAAGDMFVYGTAPGGTQTVTEAAGVTPTALWGSPLILNGDTEIDVAPEVAAEGAYDLVFYYTPLTANGRITAAE